jgi:hypothetical protein
MFSELVGVDIIPRLAHHERLNNFRALIQRSLPYPRRKDEKNKRLSFYQSPFPSVPGYQFFPGYNTSKYVPSEFIVFSMNDKDQSC